MRRAGRPSIDYLETRFAHIHIESITQEVLPVGGLAELLIRYKLHSRNQEAFWVIANDRAGVVRTIVEVAQGTGDKVDVDIPSMLTAVLAAGAAAFSVAHNHPTMSVLPSQADMDLTRAIMNAANILGLLFEDHVIVEPRGDSFSFRDVGLITGVTRPPLRTANEVSQLDKEGRDVSKPSVETCSIHEGNCNRVFRTGSKGLTRHAPRLTPADEVR